MGLGALCLCCVVCTWVCVGGTKQCLNGIVINVILLDDEESPWSLKYVKGAILKAIEKDSAINVAEGK